MRFFVEVTMIGKTNSQVYCVSAGSWQPALEATRLLRGEPKSLEGFSIELVDEGCRAIDPGAKWRYVVRKAPEDAPLTEVTKPAEKAAEKPAEKLVEPTKAGTKTSEASKPDPKSRENKVHELKPQDAKTATPAPAASASASTPPADDKKSANAQRPSQLPRAESSERLKSAAPPKVRSIVYGENGAVAAVRTDVPEEPRTVPNLPSPPSTPEVGSSVAVKTLFEREQLPNAASPIHYHEGVYAVPEGTEDAIAETLLREKLTAFRAKLVGAKPVNYINIAIFDREFEGKPRVLPIATISYRDWKGIEPEISFPRRAKARASAPTRLSAGLGDAARIATGSNKTVEPVRAVPGAPSGFPPVSSPPPAADKPAPLPASIAAIADAFAKASQPPRAEPTSEVAIPLSARIAPLAPPVPHIGPEAFADVTEREISKFDLPSEPESPTPLMRVFNEAGPTIPSSPPFAGATVPSTPPANKSDGYLPQLPPPDGARPSAAPPFPVPEPFPSAPSATFSAASAVGAAQSPSASKLAVASAVAPRPPPSTGNMAASASAKNGSNGSAPPAPLAANAGAPLSSPATVQGLAPSAPIPATTGPIAAPVATAPVAAATATLTNDVQVIPPPEKTAPLLPTIAESGVLLDFTPPPGVQVFSPPGSTNLQASRPASENMAVAPPSSRGSRRKLTPHDPFPTAGNGGTAGRTGAEELLPSLFEQVHDLHFLDDTFDGAYFILKVANDQIPCRAAMIHFFDVTKREYVLVSAIGNGTRSLLAKRHPESDVLLSGAAKAKSPSTINDAENQDGAFIERFEKIGGAKRILVVPIAHYGRTLGMVELINPIDGLPFEEVEAHAISYLAGQLGEFIGQRGLALEPVRIAAAADRHGIV